ncbi:hypothetical protein [Marisediminicola sp. LYQ134]|uniref:hypothetical protein n=1 Tax=Marisediminicola sp. LYQ134 TaxID=3391061 RepID=UPI00398379E6
MPTDIARPPPSTAAVWPTGPVPTGEQTPASVDDLVLASHLAQTGGLDGLYRAVRAGRFLRLARGVFVAETIWRGMSADERYLATVRACARSVPHRELLFSHHSAAALWRLPVLGAWPRLPEVVREPAPGGRSRRALTVHPDGVPDDTVLIDGLRATTLARTAVDIARTAPFARAVAMTDRALAIGTVESSDFSATLRAEAEAHPSPKGSARARRVLAFADPRSDSAGESLSRVTMSLLGFAPPELQREFRDRAGSMFADFWWPSAHGGEAGIVGEFDGVGKYLRSDMLGAHSTADALMAEKRREDRIRALGPRVVRWGWDTARSLSELERVLAAAGVPRAPHARGVR